MGSLFARGEFIDDSHEFFGDSVKRWNNRLSLEGCSYSKEYSSGRLALVLNLDLSRLLQRQSERTIKEVVGTVERHLLIVLKAKTVNPHKLQAWDERLMFVPDIEVVQSPNVRVPTLVGSNIVQKVSAEFGCNLLLFKTASQEIYKTIPRIENWKSCKVARISDDAIPEVIQRTPEVVQGVAHDESNIIRWKFGQLYVDIQKACACLRVELNRHSVEVGIGKINQYGVDLADVLVGPFNLQP